MRLQRKQLPQGDQVPVRYTTGREEVMYEGNKHVSAYPHITRVQFHKKRVTLQNGQKQNEQSGDHHFGF